MTACIGLFIVLTTWSSPGFPSRHAYINPCWITYLVEIKSGYFDAACGVHMQGGSQAVLETCDMVRDKIAAFGVKP